MNLISRLFPILLCLVVFSQAQAAITELDNAALHKLIQEGAVVVDVRREDEWRRTGVVAGSHLLTFFDKRGRYDAPAWLRELDKIASKDSRVVLICAQGVRSKSIAGLLDRRLGYTRVHNVTRGIEHWIRKGEPVVKAELP